MCCLTKSFRKGFLATGTSFAVLVSDWDCVQNGHAYRIGICLLVHVMTFLSSLLPQPEPDPAHAVGVF